MPLRIQERAPRAPEELEIAEEETTGQQQEIWSMTCLGVSGLASEEAGKSSRGGGGCQGRRRLPSKETNSPTWQQVKIPQSDPIKNLITGNKNSLWQGYFI
jgi:hypothetical protein